MKLTSLTAPILFLVLSGCFGCATILNDDTQPVTFNSTPEGALVKVDGTGFGRTPVTVQVQRKGFNKAIEMSLEGYKTEHFTLENNPVTGATLLNILWFPGAIVDGVSGRGGSYRNVVSIALEPGVGINVRVTGKSNEATTPTK